MNSRLSAKVLLLRVPWVYFYILAMGGVILATMSFCSDSAHGGDVRDDIAALAACAAVCFYVDVRPTVARMLRRRGGRLAIDAKSGSGS